MCAVVTIGDMRRLEQAAVDSGAVTYEELMERAGTAAANEIIERLVVPSCSSVLVLCGNGNNGGDGYVIARVIKERCPALTVRAVRVCGPSVTDLAKQNENRVDAVYDLAEYDSDLVNEHTVVVDAVYGIGFHGELSESLRGVFATVMAAGAVVAAVDIPSGMHADSGQYDPSTLAATLTVTFTANKPAAVLPTTRHLFGEIVVADVGIDPALTAAYTTPFSVIDDETVRTHLPPRPADGHKGTFGRLLSVCGSYGMVGAALLSGKAALRMGIGLLHAALPRSVYPIAAGQLWEAVYHPLEETADGTFGESSVNTVAVLMENKTAVLIGCGLSQNEETVRFVRELLPKVTVPMVLDADGLNAVSPHILSLKAVHAPMVLTPHPAEAARLLGTSVSTIERDRPLAVKRLAKESGAVVVLKGHRTLIADPNGTVLMNQSGNSGMATGGSGDVLSGMIAALLAQGVSAWNAATMGVYLHGRAGDLAAACYGKIAMLPTDMIEMLTRLLSEYE